VNKLLLAALLAFSASAHAEQRQESAQCVLYIEQNDNQHIHVRVPVCFDRHGNVVVNDFDENMSVTSRKRCEVDKIEGVERVDQSTYLVRTFCKGGIPEHQTLVFQILDDGDGGRLLITNAENS
jgi:hypothetical protein